MDELARDGCYFKQAVKYMAKSMWTLHTLICYYNSMGGFSIRF